MDVIRLKEKVRLPGGALHHIGESICVSAEMATDLCERGLAERSDPPTAATHVAALNGPPADKQVHRPDLKKGRA